ncbi:amino acid/amide ABC transporter substrate-binding protein, HAAT family [Variovorax sp. YR752]|nr:amino acid/amide ABC transporter substrate-binding protein, HAAT family [Variovorax sp. YR752]
MKHGGLAQWLAAMAIATAAMSNACALEVLVAQVAPIRGLEARQGAGYAAGMRLAFEAANRRGGVNGHTFVLTTEDDGSRPESTVEQTRKLLTEKRPLVLAGYFGSQNLRELLAARLLEQQHIALVGYRTTDIAPAHAQLFNVRADIPSELAKLTNQLATVGVTKLGLLYEAGPGADAIVAAADQAAAQAKVRFLTRTSYASGNRSASTSIADAVQVFTKAAPQAIILVVNGAPTAAFIEAYRLSGGTAQLFAYSGADIEQLSQRLGEDHLKGVVISQVTPNPYKSTSRLVREFTEAVAQQKPKESKSYVMMEGYIAGRVIVEAVQRQGRTPTREGMIAVLNAMNDYDLGDYTIGFSGGARSGSRFVELSIVNSNGKVQQ